MDRAPSPVTEQILNLTLEIIFLLTGEDYSIVKKPGGRSAKTNRHGSTGTVPDGHVPRDPQKTKKILEVTKKITHLLIGEVPIRCQDVTVHFTMEEWEYIEDHKDLYQDVIMEDPRPPASPGSPRRSTDGSPLRGIKEEPYGDNILRPQHYIQPEMKEEPVWCGGGTLPDPNLPTPHYPVTHVKEERGSCDEEDFQNPNKKPFHNAQNKDDQVHQDGEDLPYPKVHAVNEYTQQRSSPRVYEEPSQGGTPLSRVPRRPSSSATLGVDRPSAPGGLVTVQFACPECHKCFLSVAELATHQRIHVAEKLLQTGTHVFTAAIVHAPQEPPVRHKLLPCSICGRTFYTKSSLVGHTKAHWRRNKRSNESLKCDVCGKSFSTSFLLNMHTRLHKRYSWSASVGSSTPDNNHNRDCKKTQ